MQAQSRQKLKMPAVVRPEIIGFTTVGQANQIRRLVVEELFVGRFASSASVGGCGAFVNVGEA